VSPSIHACRIVVSFRIPVLGIQRALASNENVVSPLRSFHGLPLVLLAACFIDIKLPSVDLSVLPHDATGRVTLIEIAGSRLDLDPSQSDAITAQGACADLVTYCVSSSSTLDQCVDGARTCSTSTPWNESKSCCPSACRDAYHEARNGGADPAAAFDRVWFETPDCFPGVRSALEAP
jgi:hypothetical protein